ncbi:hypothetical protein Tsubulata_024868 [Turnera subulata]|uniref:CCHC-type domain-containing protein n=1 Tax=Turnera subulata TaxID=218843 RepID=A0A9Q0J8I2_9ROSI|nr:hypothetical protein Tsubulata_024868 [Turnera subulata]
MAFYHSDSDDDLIMYKEMKALDELEYGKWLEWEASFQKVMVCLGLSVALDEEKPNEPTQDTSPDEKAKYQKWMKCDEMIIFYMRGKLSKDICLTMDYDDRVDNAKQRLDALEQLVRRNERRYSMDTFQELMDMRYEGEGEVGRHLDLVHALVQKLRAADLVLPLHFVKKLAFKSLPSEFVPFMCANSAEELEWRELRRRCVDFEMVLMKFRERESRCDQQGENGAKKRRLVQCYRCGKYGHIARNCWDAST